MAKDIIMKITNDTRRAAGLFFLRTLLGMILLMQGYGKVFTWGVENVYQNAFAEFETTWIPLIILKGTAYFTSYVELIGGLFLVLGIFRQWAYLSIGMVLIIVTYGHGLQAPIWDLHPVFFRSALLAALLLVPDEWDYWCFDRLVFRKSI